MEVGIWGWGDASKSCDLLATGAWLNELDGTWKYFYMAVTFMAVFVW